MKAYSYARFSTPEQMNGDSLRRQTDMVDKWLAAHPDAELDQQLTLRDLGVSAHHGKNARSGALGQFLKAIDQGLIEPGSYLLVENLDRVSRADPWDALPIFQLIINGGVTIVTLQDGKVWSREALRANAMMIMESIFVMIRAHEESDTKARRIRAVWENKRTKAAGKVAVTARGPAWLRLVDGEWQKIEDRASVVRRIFEQTVQGVGQHAIAEQLNREVVAVFGGGSRWHRSYIAKILGSSTVIGTMTPHTLDHVDGRKVRRPQEPIDGYYPAVVERELFDQVQAMGATRAPLRGKHAAGTVQNILGGLACCPLCGGSMTRVNKGNGSKGGSPKLVCANAKERGGCKYASVDYGQVERAIVGHMGTGFIGELGLGADAPSGSATMDAQMRELDGQIADHEHRLGKLLDAIESEPGSAALAKRLREVELKVLELKDRRLELERQATATIGPKSRLEALHKCLASKSLDVPAANSLLRQCAKAVAVDYERKSLIIRWQFGGESKLYYGAFAKGRTVARTKLPIRRA